MLDDRDPTALGLHRAILRLALPDEGQQIGHLFRRHHRVEIGRHRADRRRGHRPDVAAAHHHVAIAGLALLTLGTARTRLIAFPLAFLAFAIPIPLALTEPLHLVLRQFAAAGSAALLPMFGVSVFREGTVLHTTVGPVTIVDACSGFSTLYASVAVASLAAYSATGWRRRALVFLSVAPIALGANLLRVLLLILLVLWYGWGVLDTFIHPLSGMITFVLALPLIFWLGGPVRQAA